MFLYLIQTVRHSFIVQSSHEVSCADMRIFIHNGLGYKYYDKPPVAGDMSDNIIVSKIDIEEYSTPEDFEEAFQPSLNFYLDFSETHPIHAISSPDVKKVFRRRLSPELLKEVKKYFERKTANKILSEDLEIQRKLQEMFGDLSYEVVAETIYKMIYDNKYGHHELF